MSVSYNPKLVTDGMVLCFDPANQNTYPTTNSENLLLWSNDFSRNVWGGYCGSKRNQTYNTNEVLAPDGTYTATKIQRTLNDTCTGADANEVSRGIVWDSTFGGSIVSTGQTYTASIYARGINGGEALYFGLDDGSRDTSIILTTSWQRYTYTGVISQSPTRGLQTTLISLNAGCYIWGAQVETGPVATTYTQTTTSPIRRTFRDLNSGSSSTLINSYGLNTTAYGVPVLEINNNGTTSNGQVQVNTQVDLDYLARTQNFTVMFAAKKNFYGLAGNNNGNSQLFQGAINGYTSGWRIGEYSQGTPGSAFSSRHGWSLSLNDIRFAFGTSDNASSTNRMCVVGFSVSPTTCFAFVNGTTSSTANPLSYVSGTNAPFISFTGAGAGSFNGLLGYFAIYNRALSQTEIEQNYAVLRGRYGI